MASSKPWKTLRAEIEKLREQFLPDPFDPLGSYPDETKVQAHARAFLVLCHAEFESYVEGLAKEITRSSEVLWNTSRKASVPLQFLFVTRAQKLVVPEKVSAGASDIPQRLADELVKVFQNFYKEIKDNNGIKEKNILALFGPLGISSASFGATLLPNLDSFGFLRGTHVHHSIHAIGTPLDPESEYKRAVDLANDLLNLDGWYLQTKRKIR
jgi:hypothetical protein